jgi:hypothetical protein
MKTLMPSETVLEGKWGLLNGKMVGDETTIRINQLITSTLAHVATSEDGWSNLYRDPSDGRFWEHTYPQGEMHGGGPPKLQVLTRDVAIKSYGRRVDI